MNAESWVAMQEKASGSRQLGAPLWLVESCQSNGSDLIYFKTGSMEASAWARCSLSVISDEIEFMFLRRRYLFSALVRFLPYKRSISERESRWPKASLEGSRTRTRNTRASRGLNTNIKTAYRTRIQGVNVMLVVGLSMLGLGSASPPAQRFPLR